MLELLKNWDTALLLYLNGIHSPVWDYTMTLFTLTPTWLIFYGVILFFIGKKYGRKSLLVFISITLLILCADQFAGVLKHSICRLRPTNDPAISDQVRAFLSKGGKYGFVSAHSANAFSFATFSILLFKNRRYAMFILPWAAVIAYSRIYLGVHYPGDILGGAILGIGIGIGIYKLMIYAESLLFPANLFKNNSLKNEEANQIIIAGLGVALMCLMTVSLLLKNGFLIG